jgi:phosphate:Na+ symporter
LGLQNGPMRSCQRLSADIDRLLDNAGHELRVHAIAGHHIDLGNPKGLFEVLAHGHKEASRSFPMQVFGQLILGLGLFFLGMHQVGENLRRLSGPSFRSLMARTTGSPLEASMLGLVFGVLMQSATAVTFILVNMVASGLIAASAAFPVITWTNVGLTALAFLVTLNIHPLVVYLVGLSAVLAALMRKPTYQALAGVLLGIGLILYGLQTMGGAARPLEDTSWFGDILRQTVAAPAVAFLVGACVATVMQSNTASTLLIITLAGAGAFQLESALMLIYGTNLGAIVLRLFLAAKLRGTSLQLVRFEDLFCLVSGALMVALFYAETLLGVPLVRAAITWISSDLNTQLALAFFLSNLLPALVVSMFHGKCEALLAWLWPATAEEDEARPKFINPQTLADPETALASLEREIARLLTEVRGLLTSKDASGRAEALGQLAESIDAFAVQLAARPAALATSRRLNLLREELTFVRYVKEDTYQFCQSLAALGERPSAGPLRQTAQELLDRAVRAATTLDAKEIEALHENARYRGTLIGNVQQSCWAEAAQLEAPARIAVLQAVADLQMIASILHHLARLLADLVPPGAERSS